MIFDAILNRAPVAPVRLNPDLPSQLEAIINKALEKDRELRCQSAAELRADLKRMKRELDSGKSAAVASAPVSARGWRPSWVLIGAGVLSLLLLAVGAIEWFRARRSAFSAASQGSWLQITDFSDSAVSPALSPDGRILTFIRGGDTFVGMTRPSLHAVYRTTSIFLSSAARRIRCGSPRTLPTRKALRSTSGGRRVEFAATPGRSGCPCP